MFGLAFGLSAVRQLFEISSSFPATEPVVPVSSLILIGGLHITAMVGGKYKHFDILVIADLNIVYD